MRVGTASLPLHGGNAPRWLFNRMVKLGREITIAIVSEYSAEEFLRRLSHPYWFQSLGCVLGFDWHSSGLTTTVGGALKVGLKDISKDLGLYVAGGKGASSRKTPTEIEQAGMHLNDSINRINRLVYASRMSAKVDSAALQDSFQLYHHNFFFTKSGSWAVVQQGMNTQNRWARRYHWLSEKVENFVEEPHSAIASDHKTKTLDLTATSSEQNRKLSTLIAQEEPEKVLRQYNKIIELKMPHHEIIHESDIRPENLLKVLKTTHDKKLINFESLIGTTGVGPRTVRALSLISELVYNAPASKKDPVKYSFTHGGKDGTPFPVDKQTYDQSIEILKKAINKSKIGEYEKMHAFRRLQNFL